MPSKPRQGVPSPTQKVITIKHGSAPEIQAVNISGKKKRSGASKYSDEILYETDEGLEQPFYRNRPLSKTMTTTKSTMTNDEDYQIEITKSIEGNASETTSVHQNELDQIDDTTDDIRIAVVKGAQQQQKVLAWKMTPKVHFPMREDSQLGSPVPGSVAHFHGSLIGSSKVVDWNYLPEPVIDPPFEHRPDKSYLIHQNQPIPLNPLKVWPGYGGNLYFEPVRVESKPLNTRENSGMEMSLRSRSRANSRHTYGETATTPDALSDSRYMYQPSFSPYRPKSRKDTPTSFKYPLQELQGSQPSDLLFQRKMAHLDKDYVLNMKGNPKLHEDWSWIAGLESIGTLSIGDTSDPLKRQPPKPYSRTLVAEKVPRKFVFHPGNNPRFSSATQSARPIPLVQVKIDTKKRNRYPSRQLSFRRQRSSSSKSASNQVYTSSSRTPDAKQKELKRRLQLPTLPIRVKGHKVNETSCYNPWDLFKIGYSKAPSPNPSRTSSPPKPRSVARNIISALLHSSPNDRENLSFAVTGHPSPGMSEKHVSKDYFIPKPNAYPPQSVDHETDDEDKLNYETIRSVYDVTRDHRTTADGRRVPNSTPC